ncbi:MAG: BMP family ABC transporter substrate-binding protein [Candidatus Bathyarchaeia archaeon]|jgi:basic membrane protein A
MSETPKKTPKTVIAGVVIIVLIIAAGVAYYFTQTSPSGPTMTTNSQSMTSAAPLKIAMILPGRIDDLAWNQAGYTSFEELLTAQGQGINTCGCWIQNHQEKAQIEADIADLASKGFNLIIGHGFEFQVPAQEVAPNYPNVNFLVIGGWNNSLPNLAIADVRTDQTGYVLGYLAGTMTKTDKIGYIMGARVAELARFEPNFAKGAQDANPKIIYTYGALPGGGNGIQPGGSISVVAVGDFHDLQGAKADAELMASQGIDVIATMGDGVVLGTIEGAIDKNVSLIGNGVDIANNPPIGAEKLVLGSGSWKWNAVFTQWLSDVAGGKRNGKYWAGFDNAGLEVELNANNVPAAVVTKIQSIEAQVKSGQIKTDPLGPLVIGWSSFIIAAVVSTRFPTFF